jgi:DIRAS family GTP-binding Ras-like protein 2
VVVFGSAGVGKSSLVLRFVKGTFKDNYLPTIEDTYRQVIPINKLVCTLQITDTTGSHQFPAMQRLNIQKGHAFILVYSITSRQSIEELKTIYRDILQIKGVNEIQNIPMMLVGTKCDEESNRDVSTAAAEKLANDWHCAFMEVYILINSLLLFNTKCFLFLLYRRQLKIILMLKKHFRSYLNWINVII